jgi:hypothetical protein
MNRGLSRRGQAELLEWVMRVILMIVAVVIIGALVRVFVDKDVDAADLHRTTYLYRLYYGDVIMYEDNMTGRIYPGVVDLSKATSERLDAVFVQEPQREWAITSSEIILAPNSGCLLKQRAIYNHKETFDYYSKWQVGGKGGARKETLSLPVTIRDGGIECAGMMNITVVRLNS